MLSSISPTSLVLLFTSICLAIGCVVSYLKYRTKSNELQKGLKDLSTAKQETLNDLVATEAELNRLLTVNKWQTNDLVVIDSETVFTGTQPIYSAVDTPAYTIPIIEQANYRFFIVSWNDTKTRFLLRDIDDFGTGYYRSYFVNYEDIVANETAYYREFNGPIPTTSVSYGTIIPMPIIDENTPDTHLGQNIMSIESAKVSIIRDYSKLTLSGTANKNKSFFGDIDRKSIDLNSEELDVFFETSTLEALIEELAYAEKDEAFEYAEILTQILEIQYGYIRPDVEEQETQSPDEVEVIKDKLNANLKASDERNKLNAEAVNSTTFNLELPVPNKKTTGTKRTKTKNKKLPPTNPNNGDDLEPTDVPPST